jgi:methyltransferase
VLPWPFWLLWAAVLAQRLVEVAVAAATTRRMVADGGRLVRDDGTGLMVVVHAAFFPLAAAEALWAPWPALGWWTSVGLIAFLVGEALRGWSILSLGPRWTTRVVVLPAPLVAGGPYRFLRHPIYAGVVLMLAGFLAAFGLWASLAVLLPLKLAAVTRRIRREERALGLGTVGA